MKKQCFKREVACSNKQGMTLHWPPHEQTDIPLPWWISDFVKGVVHTHDVSEIDSASVVRWLTYVSGIHFKNSGDG